MLTVNRVSAWWKSQGCLVKFIVGFFVLSFVCCACNTLFLPLANIMPYRGSTPQPVVQDERVSTPTPLPAPALSPTLVDIPTPFPTSTHIPVPTPTCTHTPSPTPTRTLTPSRTATPTRTSTPTPSPTHTPTPTSCLPGVSFVADVTVPDGTNYRPGEQFTKTWRLSSSGCAAWPAGSTWTFVSGEQMGAPDSVPVPDTLPGGTADISVNMVAPGTLGTYKGYWQMQTPGGVRFGDQVYVKIVVSVPTPTRVPTPELPPPAEGTGQAVGQLFCGGGPAVNYKVTLILFSRDRKFLKTTTDAQGWWFINNIPPGKYLRHYGLLLEGTLYYTPSETRQIKAGQLADYGVENWKNCPRR